MKLPEHESLSAVSNLTQDQIIRGKKQPMQTTANFFSYVKTPKAHWYWLTLAFSLIAILLFFEISENMYPWAYLRYVVGAVFIAWLPGYTLTKVLFPECSRREKRLDVVERAGLSFGLSLAIVSIVGLLLNYTPWGIRLTPIVLSLSAIILALATIAVSREYQTEINSAD